MITTEGESDFSPEDVVETSYTLTEYEQAKADMFGRLDVHINPTYISQDTWMMWPRISGRSQVFVASPTLWGAAW